MRNLRSWLFKRSVGRGLLFLFMFFAFAAPVLVTPSPARARERILEMNVSAVVHPNSDLTVTEEIIFVAEGRDIRRGLIRVFPIKYGERGRTFSVGFKVGSVTMDGRPAEVQTQRAGADMEIRIGSPGATLSNGRHVIVLTYTTTGQILFWENHDELYWNVTGNDWAFLIERASFRVTLPDGAEFADYDGYTGRRGAREKNYRLDAQGIFRTTRALGVNEGFTVALGWPKGIVTPPPPTFMEKAWPYITALSVLLTFAWYVFAWRRWGKDPRKGVIIPLFSPPGDMDPAKLRYVRDLRYDTPSLGTDIVYMAVKGLLTIRDSGHGDYELCAGPARQSEAREKTLMELPERLRILWGSLSPGTGIRCAFPTATKPLRKFCTIRSAL